MDTTHGLMTHADHREYLKDTDQHTVTVNLDDPPEWFTAPADGNCPLDNCGASLDDHDSVIVHAASGEIIACS
jgi:hypothetical protein